MIDIKKVKEAFEITMGYKPNQDKQLIESGIPFRIVELFPNESETIEQALNELERLQQKETYMKPIQAINYKGIEQTVCPVCQMAKVESHKNRYCHICGQKLDWSDEE